MGATHIILLLALFHVWKPKRIFVIVTVYIDESGTHGGPIITMGCLVGSVGQWKLFDEKWNEHLHTNKLTFYHSQKLKPSQGEFKGWKIDRKFAFLRRAAAITEDHTMFGISSVMWYTDYNKHYVGNERPTKIQLDAMYSLRFRFCLLRLAC